MIWHYFGIRVVPENRLASRHMDVSNKFRHKARWYLLADILGYNMLLSMGFPDTIRSGLNIGWMGRREDELRLMQ